MESGYLAKILSDLGAETCDRNMFLDVLQQLRPLLTKDKIESQVAIAIIMMLLQTTKQASNELPKPLWNMTAFGSSVLESFPKFDLNEVIGSFDCPQLQVNDPRSAEIIVNTLRAMSKDFYGQVNAISFMKPWRNAKNQLNFLLNCLLVSPEVLNFSLLNGRKVLSVEDFSSLSPAARNIAATLASQTWNSMALFEFTANILDTENFEDAKPIFELASRQCPELLCIALAALDPSWNSINKEILVKLTCGFLLGQPSSSVVLPRIWIKNPNMLLFCMVEMHRRDSSCLSRLLDVAQELKILHVILDAKPYGFTIDLACLASRRQNLNLEKWFVESLKDKGELFLKSAVEFLADKASIYVNSGRQASNTPNPPIHVPIDVLNMFIRVLSNLVHILPADSHEQLLEVKRLLGVEAFPPSHSPVESPVSMVSDVHFSADVEEEVNNVFDRIFAREISVPDVIDILRRLKTSSSIRDQQVFSCFLHNIFDEYRFFAKYPENELILTAILFGQMINCGLISYIPLSAALKCVLDSLKKPTNQKLFKFGLQAVLQFYQRLPEWPQYCSHLLQLLHIQHLCPDLFNYIRSCVSGSTLTSPISSTVPAGSAVGTAILPLEGSSDHPLSTTTSMHDPVNPLFDAALKRKFLSPVEGIRDRILFIINNLSLSNLENKSNDLVKVIEEAHFAWLAQYLVVFRASQEPNYHALYHEFLKTLQISQLNSHVLSQTYENIYILLESQKITTSSAERSLLKNLGTWLGGLTLARDQPILHRDLSLKDLLIDAFVRDRLIAIIPFVCKVVEQSAYSRAFIPENPWLMALLRLLAELYNFADMKLNLKFEIEVLCKNLNVELHSLEPSELLHPKVSSGVSVDKSIDPKVNDVSNGLPFCVLTNLVSLNGRFGSSRIGGILKVIFALSMEYSIREIGTPVIEKALRQALLSTKVVAGKDFASESDDNLFFQSACNMATAVTVHLSGVLARDNLRGSIINNLKAFSQVANLSHLVSDAVAESLIDDNLDLACAYVEKLSLEHSRPKIEATFKAEIPLRARLMSTAPLGSDQLRVYEEFSRKARPNHLVALPSISFENPSHAELERSASLIATAASGISVSNVSGSGAREASNTFGSCLMSPGVPAADAGLDAFFETVCLKFIEHVTSIERLVLDLPPDIDSISELPPNDEIRSLMKQVIVLASSSPIHRDELCLLMSQRLMQGLYKTDSPLYVDVIILLLIKIFEFSSKAAKEVTTWVVHSTDERKYSVLATTALFSSGLIYVLDFDGQLAKQIEGGREAAITFSVALIRKCIFGDPPVAAPYDFVYSLEALGKIVQTSISKSSITDLLKEVAAMVKAPQPETQVLRDQITFCFTDWFRLCQYPSISDKLISSFVSQLFQRRFLADESSARPFFQICTEICIELYVRQRRAPAILAYRSIDAFARLVGQIIKFHPGPEGGVDSLRIVTIVHSVAGLILIQGLEQDLDYLQRPFSRLFVSLASEILRITDSWDILENLCTFYEMISPNSYPQFAFGWLELICNRDFMPRILGGGDRKGWPLFAQLFEEYLSFSYPLLTDYDSHESTKTLYRGILRSLLVILHDFSDFLLSYGRAFASLVPLSAVQLRNTLLAAIPNSSKELLPDPLNNAIAMVFKREDVEASLCEFSGEYFFQLGSNIKSITEDLCQGKGNSSAQQLANLCMQSAPSSRMMNLTLILGHLSRFSLLHFGDEYNTRDAVKLTPIYDLIGYCCTQGGTDGRYLAVNAIADFLTFPGPQTTFFYCLMIQLFEDSKLNAATKETIARVLLERLIVHRPHPWGVMVTFIELVKNPLYRFWDLPFTKANPEVERVFEAISRSCLPAKTAPLMEHR